MPEYPGSSVNMRKSDVSGYFLHFPIVISCLLTKFIRN